MKSKTPWNADVTDVAPLNGPINDMTLDIKDVANQDEAPDPVEFAQRAAAPTQMPALGDAPTGDATGQALLMIAQLLKEFQTKDSGASTHLQAIERLLANQEATRPHENLFNPPMFSNYNPQGDFAHPRPELPFRVFWVGYELKPHALTHVEIALLSRLQPGAFRVTKANGRTIPFTVKAKIADSGAVESMAIHFPCKGPEHRGDHGSMVNYLREIYGEQATPDMLHAQIVALKAEIAAAQTAQG